MSTHLIDQERHKMVEFIKQTCTSHKSSKDALLKNSDLIDITTEIKKHMETQNIKPELRVEIDTYWINIMSRLIKSRLLIKT